MGGLNFDTLFNRFSLNCRKSLSLDKRSEIQLKRRIQVIILTLILLNGIFGISFVGINADVESISADPPASGDWEITTSEILTGSWKLNGSIVVRSNAFLTITNAHVEFMGATDGTLSDGEWNVTVEERGSLTIFNSTIKTDDPTFRTYIRAKKFSMISITDSQIYNIGTSNSQYGLWIEESNSTTISGNIIEGYSTGCLYFDTCTMVEISNNVISSNASGTVISVYNSTDFLISENSITKSDSGAGRAMSLSYSSDITLENNYLRNGIDYFTLAIYLTNNSIIRGNTLNNSLGDAASICIYGGYGNHNQIEENIFYHHDSDTVFNWPAINLRTANDTLIRNNVFNETNKAIGDTQGTPSLITHTTIRGNTFNTTLNQTIFFDKGGDAVTIENNLFKGTVSGTAIELQNYNDTSITGNIIDNVYEGNGVEVTNAVDVRITNNIITDISPLVNLYRGINVTDCNHTVIHNNTLNNIGGRGIFVDATNQNFNVNITENTVTHGMFIGIEVLHTEDGNISGNLVDTTGSDSLKISYCEFIAISKNILRASLNAGIYIYNSGNITVFENYIQFVNSQGICLSGSSTADNLIYKNYVSYSYYGLYLSSSVGLNNTVKENILIHNMNYGLYNYGNNIYFVGNLIIDNLRGLYVLGDSGIYANNTILFNYIGISVHSNSEDAFFYGNDIIGNSIQAQDEGTNTTWSHHIVLVDAYFGNYWSDYIGEDLLEPFGHGDTPYITTGSAGSVDEHPLISMYNPAAIAPPEISQPLDITIIQGTSGHNLVWTGYSLIGATYTIFVDGVGIYTSKWDGISHVVYSIDGLSVGIYTVTCVFEDLLGQTSSDTVQVTVASPPDTTTDPSPTDPNNFLPGAMVGFIAGGLLASIVLIIMFRRRK